MRVSGSYRGFSRHQNRRKKRNSQSHSQLYFTTIPSRGKGPLIDAYAQHLERQLVAAIDAFATGRMSDDQAAYLDYFVRQGLLSNRPSPLVVEYRRLENEIAIPRRAPGIIEEAGPDHPLLLRGDPQRLGDPVPRRFLTALDGQAYGDRQSMRLALANDLTSLKNPLTTRVIVNRLYQYLFREGIVATPDNFGKLGAVPKDPDLLDALAKQFVADGWSIKQMLRRLVLSPAYQSGQLPTRRLEAEEIRDSILAATGQLDPTMYGQSVPVYYAHETGSTKGDRPKGPLDGASRRSVYLEIRRNATHPFLEVFDVYKPTSTRGQRDVTNVPAQSLALMNSPFVIDQSGKWAAILGESPDRVDQLYLRTLGRAPTASERDQAESFAAEVKLFAPLVHAIFNLKESLYKAPSSIPSAPNRCRTSRPRVTPPCSSVNWLSSPRATANTPAGAPNPQVEAAIQNYETAYRMQTGVPELVDLRAESEATKKLYGMDSPNQEKAAYARQCLLARRLVEGGVRFIELSHVAPLASVAATPGTNTGASATATPRMPSSSTNPSGH